MPSKRKSRDGPVDDESSPVTSAKRPRQNDARKEKQRRADNSYGQTSAIPGLDDADGDGGDECTREAVAYLKMVRSEARGIPGLLVAPKERAADEESPDSSDDSAMEDKRGFYEDGAYVAAPKIGPVMPPGFRTTTNDENDPNGSSAIVDISPQEAFTNRMLALLQAQRASLQSISSEVARKKSLERGVPIRLPKSKPYSSFVSLIHTCEPRPTHLAALDHATVLKMLVQARTRLMRRQNVEKRFSEWVWGLFCRLSDVGTLDSEAVSVVRELGKKAVWVGIGFLGGDSATMTEEYQEGDSQEEFDAEGGAEVVGSVEDDEEVAVEETGNFTRHQSSGMQANRRRNTSSPSIPDFDIKIVQETDRITRRQSEEILQNGRTNTSSPNAPAFGIKSVVTNGRHEISDEQMNEDCDEEHQSKEPADLDSVKAQLLNLLAAKSLNEDKEACPDANTRATIDMIITIAGEMYGQRDLLEFRAVWGGEMGLWG